MPVQVSAVADSAREAGWSALAVYDSPAWLLLLTPPPRSGRPSRVSVTVEMRPRPAWQVVAAVERIDWGSRVAVRALSAKQVRSALRGTG